MSDQIITTRIRSLETVLLQEPLDIWLEQDIATGMWTARSPGISTYGNGDGVEIAINDLQTAIEELWRDLKQESDMSRSWRTEIALLDRLIVQE